jgi:hypothetical protein
MSNRSPIISVQFPADLAAWLQAKAKDSTSTVSVVLRGLVIKARAREAAEAIPGLPVMDEEDVARRSARILTATQAKAKARGAR